MPNVIQTDKGRILDLPVSVKDIDYKENIIATNAPGGRLYIDDSEDVVYLRDVSLLDEESELYQYISLPLIEDLQVDEELSLASKLKQIQEIENSRYTK